LSKKSIDSDPIDPNDQALLVRYIRRMNDQPQIVLCTVPDTGTAKTIANALVTEQLAACVNIIPGITSVYRWKESIENDAELLLIIKTAASAWPRLEQRILTLHPYELPEIIAVPIQTGQTDYIQWITDSLK
jgi:periplasmic divalent cation tolerance protein